MRRQVVVGKGFELKNAAAAGEGAIHRKVGVLGGGANEDNGAIFHVRQEGILLRLVKTVHLIDKQNGALLRRLQTLAGFG